MSKKTYMICTIVLAILTLVMGEVARRFEFNFMYVIFGTVFIYSILNSVYAKNKDNK